MISTFRYITNLDTNRHYLNNSNFFSKKRLILNYDYSILKLRQITIILSLKFFSRMIFLTESLILNNYFYSLETLLKAID